MSIERITPPRRGSRERRPGDDEAIKVRQGRREQERLTRPERGVATARDKSSPGERPHALSLISAAGAGAHAQSPASEHGSACLWNTTGKPGVRSGRLRHVGAPAAWKHAWWRRRRLGVPTASRRITIITTSIVEATDSVTAPAMLPSTRPGEQRRSAPPPRRRTALEQHTHSRLLCAEATT